MKWQKKTKNHERYELVDYPFFDTMINYSDGTYYISGYRTQVFDNLDDAKKFMIINIYYECLKCIDDDGYLKRCPIIYATCSDFLKLIVCHSNCILKYNNDITLEELEKIRLKLVYRHINRFIREYKSLNGK